MTLCNYHTCGITQPSVTTIQIVMLLINILTDNISIGGGEGYGDHDRMSEVDRPTDIKMDDTTAFRQQLRDIGGSLYFLLFFYLNLIFHLMIL